jgi:hypothetical protein
MILAWRIRSRFAANSKIEDQPRDDSPKSKIRRRRGQNRPNDPLARASTAMIQ